MTGKWISDEDAYGHRAADDARPDQKSAADPNQGAASDDSRDRAQLLAENAEFKDRLLRALAEAENTRRRAERDLDNMRRYAVTKFAGDMLDVADNLERAISSIPADAEERQGAFKTLVEGVELTEKELLRSLEKHGIRKLDPLGERFDPNFHEALFEVHDPSVPHGTVAKVLQAGYAIGARALRPAKVGVASGGTQGGTTPTSASETGAPPDRGT